jgi:hypothetical protein
MLASETLRKRYYELVWRLFGLEWTADPRRRALPLRALLALCMWAARLVVPIILPFAVVVAAHYASWYGALGVLAAEIAVSHQLRARVRAAKAGGDASPPSPGPNTGEPDVGVATDGL